MAQFTLANFNRFILDTEDDANSPLSEELMTQLRENLVGLLILMLDTGVSGTATGVSGAVLTDTGDCGGITNGWTLLITSGAAKGNIYTIDAHDSNSITCTGDDLEADGVAATHTWKALYDCKVNADGHDHDGVNSKVVGGTALTRTVLTGSWNMDTAAFLNVAHGLTLANIRSVTCMILDDAGTNLYCLNYDDLAGVCEGKWTVDATNVTMTRLAGGMFDADVFDAATYNIIIWSV